MENVCTTEGKITATTKLSTMETTSSQVPTLIITGRTGKLGQHLYIIQTTHPHSNSTTEKGTCFQWHVTTSNKCTKKSLLPFLCDALSWFTRTAMTKGLRDNKRRVNQLIETQIHQQDTLVHVISILNVPDMPHKSTGNKSVWSWKQFREHTMMLPHISTSQGQYIPT